MSSKLAAAVGGDLDSNGKNSSRRGGLNGRRRRLLPCSSTSSGGNVVDYFVMYGTDVMGRENGEQEFYGDDDHGRRPENCRSRDVGDGSVRETGESWRRNLRQSLPREGESDWEDWKIVALKKTRLHEDEEGVPPTTLREISLLLMLSRDPHIVSFRQTGESIPPKTIKSLLYQLCKGVAFCHGHGVLHRDLKPHNLLMDRKTSMLKIADLGLARSFTLPIKKYTHEILTLWYRAPEVLLGATHYSTAVDMWPVGCIFGVSKLVNWHEYPQWKPQPLSSSVPNLDENGLNLLAEMLHYEPSRRISAKKAMEHPYFDDLDNLILTI
nr:cell division control protein 2 homolog D [Ipomoea batatas]